VANTQEEYCTLNPLFPCSNPKPVVSSVKKPFLILFAVLTILFLLTTIILAILFAIEKQKTKESSKNLF